MNKSKSVTADTLGGHVYTSSAARWQEQRCLVGLVAAAYRAVNSLPPTIAMNHDEQARNRSSRWSPDTAHYGIDVQNTVQRVIEAKPEDERGELWAAWEALLKDDTKLGNAEQKLIRLLAGPFFTKKLHPRLYFRSNRYAHRRPR